MSLPIEARQVRGGISIRLTEADIKYIAKNLLPDALGLDPMRQTVKVNDGEALAAAVVRAMNTELSDDGYTMLNELVEKALTAVFEDGDESLEVVTADDDGDD